MSNGRSILEIVDSHRASQSSHPLDPLSLQNAPRNAFAHMYQAARQRHAELSQAAPSQVWEDDAEYMTTGLTSSGSFHVPGDGGFSLHYDDSTALRSIDFGGPDQAQKMSQFITSAIDNISHGLTVEKAYADIDLSSPQDPIPGMEVRLLPHQAVGVAWMIAREKHEDKGGILADDMGLGKTIQMIATMVKNMPPMDERNKTTLVVVPAALLQQWKDEIESKTNDIFVVHVHHGKDKLKKASEVRSKDVVITTYQTLSQDFNVPTDLEPEEVDQFLQQYGGPLAKTKFFRAIVDEAQFIRNRSTVASTSLAYVRAKYRWLLTGTPVTNTLADIYGLIRFGRFRPWNDWNDFNAAVVKVQAQDALEAGMKAQAILRPLILRRTKDSTLEGKPILQLPAKHIELVDLEFSKDEREIYTAVETQTRIQVNKFIRNGTLMKNHAFVLVLLLRLRQLCCHPHLTLSTNEEDNGSQTSGGVDLELSRAKRIMGQAWVDSVKRKFVLIVRVHEGLVQNIDTSLVEGDSCPVCKEVYTGDTGRVLPCGHRLCFDCLVELHTSDIAHDGIFGQGTEKENLAREKEFENAQSKGLRPCPVCKQMTALKGPKIFKSAAFQPTDEEIRARSAASKPKKRARDSEHESESDVEITDAKMPPKSLNLDDFDNLLADSDDELVDLSVLSAKVKAERDGKKGKKRKRRDSDDELEIVSTTNTPAKNKKDSLLSDLDSDDDMGLITSPSKRKGRNSGGKSNLGKEAKNSMGVSSAVMALWKKGDDDLEPSTKMMAMLSLLKSWDSSGDKTIIYSQWTANLDLIEKVFSRYGIRSLRFDGSMDRNERDQVLAQFRVPTGPKVILISTRAGSVGLNLVSANRVINMDLSWNYAAESQAYDRAHRIGQDKEVFIHRLVIKDTIEERMLKLQDVKMGLAEAALGEGTGGRLQKFSVKDIQYLFGIGKKNDSTKNNDSGNGPPPA